jgi:phage terminase large subunit
MTKVVIDDAVYNDVYLPYLQDTTPLQIFFGGSSSGKSVFLAQRCVEDLMHGKRNYLVCREVGRTIRGSVSQEIQKVIREWGLSELFDINKTDGTITCHNGYQCIFSGLDDVEKLKSITPAVGVITDVWVEEATEIERDSMKQLEKRLRGGSENVTKRITLSFNPTLQTSWIYLEYFATIAWADDQTEYHDENISILKTTYKDNKFLTKQDRKKLEDEKDPYYRDVYTLGKWGVLGDIIFTNWTVIDMSGMLDQFTNHRNGLDFGFSSDPAAMAVMHYDGMRNQLYIYDELYERGLTNKLLAVEVKKKIGIYKKVKKTQDDGTVIEELVFSGTEPVTCDSAEPKSIQELCDEGVSAYGAKKGKDSVNFGIQWLQGLEIFIDAKCVNAKREFSTFHWKKDKDGNSMRVPVGKDDHLIAGARYGMEDDMINGSAETVENPFF